VRNVPGFIGDLRSTGTDESPLPENRDWVNSPYSWLIVRLARTMDTRVAVAVGFALNAILPFIVFIVWYLTRETGPGTGRSCQDLNSVASELNWMVPIASLWIVLGPTMMFIGEVNYGRTLRELRRTRHDGWNFDAVDNHTQMASRLRIPIIGAVTVAILSVYIGGHDWFHNCLGVSSKDNLVPYVAGLFVLIQMGLSVGLGMWGVYKSIGFIFAATRFPKTRGATPIPPWTPFRPNQVPGLEALSKFNLKIALVFSSGSVMTPAISIIALYGDFSGLQLIILLTSVMVLLLGSSVLFMVPTVKLRKLASRLHNDYLTDLGKHIEHLKQVANKPNATQNTWLELQHLIDTYTLATTQTAFPSNLQVLSRIPASIVLPLLSLTGTYVGLLLK
jgi:hypothetical protein